jgi:nitrate/nitrite transport system substrate-binding protein
MPIFDDPFDQARSLKHCTCGRHQSQREHDLANPADVLHLASGADNLITRVVESAVVRAMFPQDAQRRAFLRSVGAATAYSAIASIFPLGAATALAAEPVGALEKKQVNIGFLPITCATPIIMGQILGLYEKQGLQVTLHKAAGWETIRDKTFSGEFDASHMLAPMPLAFRLGLHGTPVSLVTPVLENLNGSSLCLAIKHRDNREPKQWKGFKFAVPFDYSVQNFLLREYFMQNGLDPERDVQVRAMTPPEMLNNMRSGAIDGFLGAEPFGQRAVYDGIGFIQLLSAELWDGHPCCAFTTSEKLVKEAPNTFAALFRSIINATNFTSQPKNGPSVAAAIAPAEYLNQPVSVLEQVLTGKYDDGLGNHKFVPRRVTFEAFPWQSMAVWLMHELKRWDYLKKDVDYKQIAEAVFLATDARKQMSELGVKAPGTNIRKHVILGREFNPDNADAYFKALPPRRSA